MELFDSHTHLNDSFFENHVEQYLKHADKLGVRYVSNVGSNLEMNQTAIDLAEKYDNCYAIVGWHPEDAINFNQKNKDLLIKQLKHPKVVALGEIGMDYHQDTTPKDVQEKVFREQIQIAKSLKMPISVHNREAFEDTYRILKEENIQEVGGIIHSFNGDTDWLNKFINLNMYISYSGVASFKKTKEVHEAVRNTPLDKILVETDAPYLAPEPLRGKDNEPAFTLYTLEAVARYKDMNPAELAKITVENTKKIFRIE
ncbi:YchF/TatD family DNA exonuclease [Lactobacillus sp. S2-2]|nr:TatD family hydrolase [Lactobacillus sp. S2-2]MCF6515849.1 YchF/TatD family DNA exonuclease [Lactobacillus sp. S2-2]